MAESTTTSDGNQAVQEIERTPVAVQWTQTLELGYEVADAKAQTILPTSTPAAPTKKSPVCFGCGKASEAKLSKCAKCNTASYCSRDCQVRDWKPISKGGGGHKGTCLAYERLSIDDETGQIKVVDPAKVRQEIFGRIRIYACSFGVHRTATLGRGFLFLQSDSTLATLSTPLPKDAYGLPITHVRAVLMHYLTLAEYDGEVCRDDFEMMQVRLQLQERVKEYNEETQIVLLMRFRCGHVALGTATLVPDYRICKTLGMQYFENNPSSVQLNLDDM